MQKNWDEDHIEQEESQQTEKGERNRKGQPKLKQAEKCGGRTEPSNCSHSTWKKNAEKGHKEQPEPQHMEKQRPKGKEKVEPQPEPQERQTPQSKQNPENPRKAGGGEHTRIG